MSTSGHPEPSTIRVMIVDDHKSILWGLERLIESTGPRMKAVATASSCAEMFRAAEAAQPDLILLDLDLNGENSIDALPELLQHCTARVLVLTGDRKPASHQAAILAGAHGVVLKDENAETILQAIEHVHSGEMWIDQALMSRVLGSIAAKGGPGRDGKPSAVVNLTEREREIIHAIVANRGAKSVVIAEVLGISEHTLRNHLTVIYDKLGLRNRIDLFAYAIEHRQELG